MDNDGYISQAEALTFLNVMMRSEGSRDDFPETAVQEFMQEMTGGDASAVSVSRDKFSEKLEDKADSFGSEVDRGFLLKSLMEKKKRSTFGGWVTRKAQSWYRCVRLKLDVSGSFRMRLSKEWQHEDMERVRGKAKKVALEAMARSMPERSTDLVVKVKLELTESLSLRETEVSISHEDTLQDVFARFINVIKTVGGVPEAQLYAGVNQPDWLVVQQGDSTGKKGFAVQNLSLLVSELDISAADTLVFVSRRLKSHEIFFKRYKRSGALKVPPKPK
eukprot:TRINITY_DN13713_c4_g1_i1.p1 TRINITY_DN13713_c4_g1~~TRINITY_DN13713_c4_g1_i1.p1  ORF type:complete len:324 (-),score=49.48 TRINITY_DN13713_c4_g1_i1:506-1333(-)